MKILCKGCNGATLIQTPARNWKKCPECGGSGVAERSVLYSLHYCPDCSIVTMTAGPKPCRGIVMQHRHPVRQTVPVPPSGGVVR